MGTSPGSERAGLLLAGRYAIQRKLGSGSMGTVYLAHDKRGGRPVALKVLKAECLDRAGLEQLQLEFRGIASLHHPQIAGAYDFGYTEEGHVPYYTREYVDGTPLSASPPGAQGEGSPLEFLKPFFDLLDALDYLHAHEILHLDVHAGNLIVAKDRKRGSVLIDFGLMRPILARKSSALLGKRSAMAPEVFGGGPIGQEADIYSVGRLLLFRFTGSMESDPKLPREIPGWGPRLTLEIERIVSKALNYDPKQRFHSAAEFLQALSCAVGEGGKTPPLFEPGEMTAGRDSELEAIEDVLREAAAGDAAALCFVGPRGIGKTRLLAEARVRAQLRGFEVVEARFHRDPLAGSSLLESLRASHGTRRKPLWLAPLAAEHGGSSFERARRAAKAYFLEEGPMLALLLDDLELADRQSGLLAEALIEESLDRRQHGIRGRGLALFVTSVEAGSPKMALLRQGRFTRRLKPLNARQSAALLSALLRPLKTPKHLVKKLARDSRGCPLLLRQMARAVRAAWRETGVVPEAVESTAFFRKGMGSQSLSQAERDPVQGQILRAIAVIARPALPEEIAVAAKLPEDSARKALRRLVHEEVLTDYRRGPSRFYELGTSEMRQELLRQVSASEAREAHERVIAFLVKHSDQGVRCLESLAFHLLAAGRREEGRAKALRTAEILRQEGLLQNAVRLLTEATSRESDPHWRLRLIEEISSVHEEAGDHEEGVAILEPVYRGELGSLVGTEAVRVRRRLGVHYHRAGLPAQALKLFREIGQLAEPVRDVDELVSVDSELAELHTLRGEFGEAEEACKRGLNLVDKARSAGWDLGGRMEMTLRASLGHLELRRMELDRARAEFEAASDLAHTFGTTGLQALIFNNLGIVYNQKNELGKARSCFQRAERLLVKSGEHRGIIVIACNLASIAAKTGDDAEASERLDHAAKLLRHYPGIRLEFQVGLTRGLVAYMQGDASAAIAAFERMIPLGRKLGDEQFVTYAEIYLAESELACGHYREALRRLLFWSKQDHEPHLGVFRRMTLSRLWPLEKLLGRTRNAGVSRKALEAIPRTEISLLEAWNDLFIAFGLSLGGEEAKTVLEGALSVFDRLKIPAGSRLAMVGLLYDAMRRGNTSRVRAALKAVESMGSSSNKVLSVLEPLSIADASLQLGEMERAEEALRRAGSAIVGLPFLELDWRMEFLRARIAEGHGDREGARNYLHRSLYTRNLLARALPARLRKGFLAQPRFKALADLAARLERPAPAPLKAGSGQETDGFEGMIGHSRPIQQIFQTIQRLRDQDVPVLITGETGTGKELAAKAIHATSPRSTGPFYALHCASLPAELFESELFGYEAGAFTGATESRSGLLEHLAGGTLLFDEVSGLSVNTQMKVLRVLDSRVVRPLGSLNTRTIDVRFLASTSEPLEALVAEGRFRADLYYRLRGVEIHLPPLRARKDDLPFLVQHFLRRHARRLERTPPLVTTPAICFLKEHDWPGNVRELETVILRALITYSPGASLGIDSLRRLLPRPVGQALFPKDLVKGRNLETLKAELERVYLTQLFEEAGGDLGKMMKVLGVKRSSLYRWFSRVGIDPKELRESLA